jgi:hypothetical protein
LDVDDKVAVLHDADACRRNSRGKKDQPDENHDPSSFKANPVGRTTT